MGKMMPQSDSETESEKGPDQEKQEEDLIPKADANAANMPANM